VTAEELVQSENLFKRFEVTILPPAEDKARTLREVRAAGMNM
jgi:hypothetical protein